MGGQTLYLPPYLVLTRVLASSRLPASCVVRVEGREAVPPVLSVPHPQDVPSEALVTPDLWESPQAPAPLPDRSPLLGGRVSSWCKNPARAGS